MTPLRLGGVRAALVVAPHPDDETIGAFGLIRWLTGRGARVRVLIASDGGASHLGSIGWPRTRLVAARRMETRRAMQRIGVAAGELRFIGLPDGRLETMDRRGLAPLARAVRHVRDAGLIILPSLRDDHADHRAVAAVASAAICGTARRLSYLVWPMRGRRERGGTLALKLGAAKAMKRAAVRSYRTQGGAIADDPAGFAISSRQLAAFARPLEIYREARR